jgi:CRISPR-associated protein Csx10
MFYLEMTLLSEACFAGGAGGSAGAVDVDLDLDPRSKLPIVRGRILKGLLVEELAGILRTLEPQKEGPWHAAAGDAFGRPAAAEHALVSFRDGRLPDALRQAVHAQGNQWPPGEVLEALSGIRQQTKMNGQTGAPEPHSLRSTRVLRAGLRFRFPVHHRRPLDERQQALIAGSAACVRHAGLHRNRGWGEVQVRVLDSTGVDVTAAWVLPLAPTWTLRTAATATDIQLAGEESQHPQTTAGARVLKYRLTLRAPVVLTTTGREPSAVESFPYVTGASVLGAMAARWLERQETLVDAAVEPTFRRLFLDGSVRWLNAYPEGAEESRLLPCPVTLVRDKREQRKEKVFDRAAADFDEGDGSTQWVRVDKPAFVRFGDEGQLWGRTPKRVPRLHHAREDREAGRSTDGAMFSYIALEAGESFVGHVLCDQAADADLVSALLQGGSIQLGRSRTATYGGQAKIEMLEEPSAEGWREAPPPMEDDDDEPEGGRWLVTLLSHYVGRGPGGQSDPRAIEQELCAALGIEPERLVACYLEPCRVSGFVSKWRMPRPVEPALAAGSVLVFEGIAPDRDAVRTLLWRAIGERRAEGFGRVAVQWQGRSQLPVGADRCPDPAPVNRPPGSDNSEPSPELHMLRRHLARNALRRALIHRGIQDADAIGGLGSPSFVARLRARVRTAFGADDFLAFLREAGYRTGDKGLKPAGLALGRARRGSQSLEEWLVDWTTGGDEQEGPGWLRSPEVQDELRRRGLSVEDLAQEDYWPLLQAHLDSFFERLRRGAVSLRSGGREE